jgi:bifunctional DNA-binding transcriptional regulator/antitoxin component of YhaV-PrlF toxin-antitoxin module
MIHGMEITMDAAGRLVIPRVIRREAALEPGVPLDIRWRDGVIEIEPMPVPVRLRRRGPLLVAIPDASVPTLPATVVERTRRELRRRSRSRSNVRQP